MEKRASQTRPLYALQTATTENEYAGGVVVEIYEAGRGWKRLLCGEQSVVGSKVLGRRIALGDGRLAPVELSQRQRPV